MFGRLSRCLSPTRQPISAYRKRSEGVFWLNSGASDDEELLRLQLEKLRIEIDAARGAADLETEKLRLEIAQLKKADFRATLSSFTPAILGVATVVIALSSLFLNKTINDAADRQRAFENYTKLTDEFSRNGSAKLGAIVGFRAFLKPLSDRSDQTIELLASDLLRERDANARRAIVDDLISAGLPAFSRVRNINVASRDKLRIAATGLLLDRYYVRIPAKKRQAGRVDYPALASRVVLDVRTAADKYDLASAKDVREARAAALEFLTSYDVDGLASQDELLSRKNGRSSAKLPEQWLQEYYDQAPAFLASSEVLRSLLKQRTSSLKNLDASGIAIYDIDLHDADLEGISFKNTLLFGVANGVDLTNADLSYAVFFVDLHRSGERGTSLCGAKLNGTTLVFPLTYVQHGKAQTVKTEELPDLTAANWWDGAGIYDKPGFSPDQLDISFPRARNELLAAYPAIQKQRICLQSTYIQRGSATPEPLFNLYELPR